jgi:hypothetical protein
LDLTGSLARRRARHYVPLSKDRDESFSRLAASVPTAAVTLPAMPLEGHWQRTNTPLRRLSPRERNVVIAGLAVTVVAVIALIVATAGSTQPAPAPGCIRADVAGRVGGERIHPCGRAAEATCARSRGFDSPRSRTILEACEAAGIKF